MLKGLKYLGAALCLVAFAANDALADAKCDAAVQSAQFSMGQVAMKENAIVKLPLIPVPPYDRRKLTPAQMATACEAWSKYDTKGLTDAFSEAVERGERQHKICKDTPRAQDLGQIARMSRDMMMGTIESRRTQCKAAGHPWK
jgi:hypothetical protein